MESLLSGHPRDQILWPLTEVVAKAGFAVIGLVSATKENNNIGKSSFCFWGKWGGGEGYPPNVSLTELIH